MRKYLAEAIGTFALVFCGTGAMVIHDVSGGVVTHIGVAITFGLIVMAMIFAFGGISGAHINPAVSIAFCFTDRFERRHLAAYIGAQLLGAFVASGVLYWLFKEHPTLGATLPAGTWQQSFVLEIILSYLLMLVILAVSQKESTKAYTAIAVGAVVGLEAMFAGPITGASMNPARSIAPALVSGQIQHLWLYIAAPIIGMIAASGTWNYLLKDQKEA